MQIEMLRCSQNSFMTENKNSTYQRGIVYVTCPYQAADKINSYKKIESLLEKETT